MTTTPDQGADLLRNGIAALKAGDHALARKFLMGAARANPQDERIWLYLAAAVSEPAQRRDCLERALRINPQSVPARRGLDALDARRNASPPHEALPAPAPPAVTPPPPVQIPPAPELRQQPATSPAPELRRPEPAPMPVAPVDAVTALLRDSDQPAPPAAVAPAVAPQLQAAPETPTLSLPAAAVIPPAETKSAPDRLVLWLVLVLGLLLMLAGGGYVFVLLL